ncbi:cytochrome b [Ferrimonas kyonanensis]|uniref:cytochrome b n=1 Tax=Ferrimonas kyonanensis TaxID=364763 RepID=UPI0004198DDE|nr:cytochrome b [Ferrimonas kyonanensis]
MKDSKQQLAPLTVALHWIVGLTLMALLAVGIYMEENEAYALYPIHKSIGMLIVVVALARIGWRSRQGWPQPLSKESRPQRLLATAVHWTLIIGTVLMPVSGMMMSGGGGHGLEIFGWQLLAANPDPANPQAVLPLSESLAGLGHELHELGGNLMIAAIVLHVAGALKHQLMDGDGTLSRMLGRRV